MKATADLKRPVPSGELRSHHAKSFTSVGLGRNVCRSTSRKKTEAMEIRCRKWLGLNAMMRASSVHCVIAMKVERINSVPPFELVVSTKLFA
jgi:hypothetical protein